MLLILTEKFLIVREINLEFVFNYGKLSSCSNHLLTNTFGSCQNYSLQFLAYWSGV